jgi:hypothetical protein
MHMHMAVFPKICWAKNYFQISKYTFIQKCCRQNLNNFEGKTLTLKNAGHMISLNLVFHLQIKGLYSFFDSSENKHNYNGHLQRLCLQARQVVACHIYST